MTTSVDLQSDTHTLPTEAMRRAMAAAEVGDESSGQDPTVRRLEETVCSMLQREAALFVISGTMANLVAIMTLCRRGDQVFADAGTHVVLNEAGGYASVAGAVITTVPSSRGHILPEKLEDAIPTPAHNHPRPRVLWFEDTHNVAGGTVLPVDQFEALMDVARRRRLLTHMDGARIFNASVALGLPVASLLNGVDSVYVDFTKGLGCPAGSMLVGSADYIAEARFHRAAVGGSMRQAGILAAAALEALRSYGPRLGEDHRLARLLAEGLHAIDGFGVDPSTVDTNIVNVDVSQLGIPAEVAGILAEEGLLVYQRPPSALRLVTHRDVDEVAVNSALAAAERAARRLGSKGRRAT